MVKFIWKIIYEYKFQEEFIYNYYKQKNSSKLISSNKRIVDDELINKIKKKFLNIHIRSSDINLISIEYIGEVLEVD